jgi:hypothetical protein
MWHRVKFTLVSPFAVEFTKTAPPLVLALHDVKLLDTISKVDALLEPGWMLIPPPFVALQDRKIISERVIDDVPEQ